MEGARGGSRRRRAISRTFAIGVRRIPAHGRPQMITLRDARWTRFDLHARLPFRYGVVTMTSMPHLLLQLDFEIDGTRARGLAAENLAPKWFTKDPAGSLVNEQEAMLAVIRGAVRDAQNVRAPSVFRFWRELTRPTESSSAPAVPPLLAQLGTSLVERALIDAFVRRHAISFATAIRDNRFEIDLGELRPTLAGSQPADWLAPPQMHAILRHTIGLSDSLESGDVAPGERRADGLPQTLEECIAVYRLQHFKIKIAGDATDAPRLTRLWRILQNRCDPERLAFSIDGNECFRDANAVAAHLRPILASLGDAFVRRILCIEQPLHREVALTENFRELRRSWPDHPAVIIDESDAGPGSLPAALALGYAGTSHKNCKGVLKSLVNACQLAQLKKSGMQTLLTGEDLTTLGPVALLQDLAVQGALGISSIERNGHHYFNGLDGFPAEMQEFAWRQHRDIYEERPGASPAVRIADGRISLASAVAAPFGYSRNFPELPQAAAV